MFLKSNIIQASSRKLQAASKNLSLAACSLRLEASSLKFTILWSACEGDYVADIRHASNKLYHTLKA